MMKSILKKTYQILFLTLASWLVFPPVHGKAAPDSLAVRGAVMTPITLSYREISAMPEFRINAVAILKEKQSRNDSETLLEVADYGGVLLRDLLYRAGMKHTRKWEPAVFVRVRCADKKEVIFSFGEIFYSSIGRSTLIAYRKNGRLIDSENGDMELVVANDIRDGRHLERVTEIVVERVNIEMKVYEEKRKDITRPPTTSFQIIDENGGLPREIRMENLTGLPAIRIPEKVQVGDCEGFHGVYAYEGILLRDLLEKVALPLFPYPYDRFIAITSENGFCATYSIGELFNSRLGNNIIVAYRKDGRVLGPEEGFAMMVAAEDNTGGRSVKRISHLILY